MIDDNKIIQASKEYNDKVEIELAKRLVSKKTSAERFSESITRQCAFEAGAKWAINESLKDLWHPTSEVPRNDYTDILVVCKEPQRPIVLFLEDILDGTPDDIASYNDMWMHLCDVYRITKYCYIGDLLPKEGGEQ